MGTVLFPRGAAEISLKRKLDSAMANQTKSGVPLLQTGSPRSGPQTKNGASGWTTSVLTFWRREFGRSEPTRVRDLVLLPLGLSASAGLVMGVMDTVHNHFLDPAFIGYLIGVYVVIQIVILLLARRWRWGSLPAEESGQAHYLLSHSSGTWRFPQCFTWCCRGQVTASPCALPCLGPSRLLAPLTVMYARDLRHG